MHLQQYDEYRCVYLTRIGRHSEKAGGNVSTHSQHRIIYFCIIMQIANMGMGENGKAKTFSVICATTVTVPVIDYFALTQNRL